MKTEYSLLGQTDDLPDQSNVDLSTTVGNVDRGGYRREGVQARAMSTSLPP